MLIKKGPTERANVCAAIPVTSGVEKLYQQGASLRQSKKTLPS